MAALVKSISRPKYLFLFLVHLSCFVWLAYAPFPSGSMGGSPSSSSPSSSSSSSFDDSFESLMVNLQIGACVILMISFCFGLVWFVIWVEGVGCSKAYSDDGHCSCFKILNRKSTVLMLQIALSAKASSVHRDWTEIHKAKTSTSTDWQWRRTLFARLLLLRHSDYFCYAYSNVTRFWRIEGAQKRLEQLGEAERKRKEMIDIESQVNLNNIQATVTTPLVPNAHKVTSKDYTVVTILVAVEGACNLPRIRTTDDVKKALNSLRDICSSRKTMGVEVYLTPKDETCSLSKEELVEHYSYLRPIDELKRCCKA